MKIVLCISRGKCRVELWCEIIIIIAKTAVHLSPLCVKKHPASHDEGWVQLHIINNLNL